MHTALPLLALGLCACLPTTEAALEAHPGLAEAEHWQPFGSAGAPGLPTPADVSSAALSAARSAALAPREWAPPPLLTAEVDPDRLQVRSLYRDLVEGSPDPRPVEGFDVVLAREPWADLSEDGTLTVRWQTTEPTTRGLVHVAIRLEEDPLAPVRHRKLRTEALDGAATDHAVSYPLEGLLSPVYDVDGIRERGWGEVVWRVEYPAAHHGTTRLADGRTAFRLEEDRWVRLPTVTLGPQVDLLLGDSMVVSFETDVPTAAAVAVGHQPPVVSTTPSRRHEIPIRGLEPDAVHVYQVAVSDGVETTLTPYNTVRTRRPGAPVRLAIASDSRSDAGSGLRSHTGVNAEVLHPLMVDAARRGAEAIVFPGDLIDGYTTLSTDFDRQLRTWLRTVEGVHASIPMYTGMGNHEQLLEAWTDRLQVDKPGEASAEARFAAAFVHPTNGPPPEEERAPPYDETVYSFDIEDVHVVMLNTNYWWTSHPGHERLEGRGNREGFLMDGQLAWLDRDLAAARDRGARHLVVTGHEPAFPVGAHLDDAMWWYAELPEVNQMRERFWRLLAEHDVLAYVSGDEHNYSRAWIGPETVEGAAGPVWSIISGGCGAPWYAQVAPEEYASQVVAFSAQQHYTLWTFDDDRVRLQAIGLTGEILDDVFLTGGGLLFTE